MWFRNTCAILLCATALINPLHATTYATLPPEKRLQICKTLLNSLQPCEPHEGIAHVWPLGKAVIALLSGAAITYAAHAYAPTTHQAAQLTTQRNKLLKLRDALKNLKANLDNNPIEHPAAQAPLIAPANPIPTYWVMLSFTATSSAIYLALGKLFDKEMQSHKAALKKFLTQWPDLVDAAPLTFREDVRPLYGAYLRDGDAVIPNERTAELIILAFTVFLTQEIEGISQSLR